MEEEGSLKQIEDQRVTESQLVSLKIVPFKLVYDAPNLMILVKENGGSVGICRSQKSNT